MSYKKQTWEQKLFESNTKLPKIEKLMLNSHTLKENGILNEKNPGDTNNQKIRLEAEGFKIEKKGKKYYFVDYDKYLAKI